MDIFSPIQQFADLATYQWFGIIPQSYWGDTINFFIYDVIKIGLLMFLINSIVTVTEYYFPMEKVRDILTKRRWYGLDYLLAALLGVVTPFCSCSSIPLFIGFISAKIPLGVTFAFLISSPLVNESSLYLFPSIFGLKVTLLYNIVGILVAVLGGMLINKLNMEKYIQPEFLKFKSKKQVEAEYEGAKVPLKDLIKHWSGNVWSITKKVFPYVLLGVGVGALIHGFVPEELVVTYLSRKDWWVVPMAVMIGAPLYANSVGVIPVIEALVGKGIPMGTALAFMTAIVTISIPEGLMLSKLMKKQLLFTFFGITIFAMILMGYLFNAIL
ncbi:MAG: permease [Candidatus Shapirobacteria bacterium]|nr:permease [Candidatus Shapirobacteria bacterium]